jgi:hypothetical protein
MVISNKPLQFLVAILVAFFPLISTANPLADSTKTNIAIHIRRGGDIKENDKEHRWVDSSVYNNLIIRLSKIIQNAHFHIFSWGNPELNVEVENLTYHTVNSGEKFIDHFNSLVHSDILVVGSSTFSISAGFFNKNKVICHESLCKLNKTPIPQQWIHNYYTLIL